MKKKWLVLGSTVGVSGLIMATTGFSVLASTSGYDAYKSALKNTRTAQSVTVQASASLQDNGSALASAAGSFKVSLDAKAASGNADVTSNGTQQSLSFFKQDGQTVLKSGSSDVYYVEADKERKGMAGHKLDGKEVPQQVETVIDALVGNLKDYVAVDAKADGSKAISVELSDTQLPTLVNVIAPLIIKEAANPDHHGMHREQKADAADLPFEEDLLQPALPQLTQNIKIDKVSVKANVNASNLIDHQEAELVVSGQDDSGASHQVTLHVQADLSGYNSTTPDTVDLTGKTVENVKLGHGNGHHDDD